MSTNQVQYAAERNSRLLLWRVDNNLVDVCSLVVESIEETSDRNSVLAALLQSELQGSRQNDALVRVSLIQGFEVLGLTIDHNTADAAKLPRAPNTIWRSPGWTMDA